MTTIDYVVQKLVNPQTDAWMDLTSHKSRAAADSLADKWRAAQPNARIRLIKRVDSLEWEKA